MQEPIAISEAAAMLGVSAARVRALANSGQLSASRVGGRWLVERGVVEARRREGVKAGRPFAPHNAWALLLLASGEEVQEIDPSVRSRLRRALATEGLAKLGSRLVRRAEVRSLSAHPGEVSHVFEDPALVRSGISAAAALGVDLVSAQEVDGYLLEDELERFAVDHALSPAGPVEGNICLRLVPRKAWAYLESRRTAPGAAVALDLAEDPDSRSASAGKKMLHDVDNEFRRN